MKEKNGAVFILVSGMMTSDTGERERDDDVKFSRWEDKRRMSNASLE